MSAAGGTPAIRAQNLTKLYKRVSAGYQLRTLKSALLGRSLTAGLDDSQSIRALQDVSFEVAPGEAFGVIGGNGSGKSTLLKLVAGLLRPTSGSIDVEGRVAALIELGAGFHPEISGRENVFINGSVLGLSRRMIEERFDSIVEFSGLGPYIDEPVKNYSSGMYVRLGFAVAIHTDPDVLLVDEVLSVGDEAFGRKCLRRIEEHLAQGRTLLVVSHSLDLVQGLCSRALWLQDGHSRGLGDPRRVIDAYRQSVTEEEERGHRAEHDRLESASLAGSLENESDLRWGSGKAEITSARPLVGSAGEEEERYSFESGSPVTFEIIARTREPLEDFVFGVAIATPRGVECWGTNTDLAGLAPALFEGEGSVRLHCPSLRLAPGEYEVDVAVHARDGSPYDYRRRCFRLLVSSPERGVGLYFPEHSWSSEGAIEWRTPFPLGQGSGSTSDSSADDVDPDGGKLRE